ncbi:MAG TPA: peptide chain release factor N(5)-glutamine methyltransferase [Hydrogenophaga sp.]|uniref:peptide chain release factor N(5)-glutamine methyltransferase n=1 Tax=Hydrogenophaga sp. TaxID=1904254 RepID=UPI002CAE41E3|nr:peptide chain release factor N(5)-glutamine methyltransferase [Hydrogenophaga sp.]HSX93984.1 peptide chain release factor N(5)-glutamine methyltransferase [Hydrogenophaga sp.]
MSIAETLRALVAAGVPRLEAQQLLLLALGRDPQARAWLAAHDELTLDDSARLRLSELTRRHHDGEPMAYLRGEQGFHGLVLRSDPRALAPRPDTETLVDWALELLDGLPPGARAIDLGTGSGAIALALLNARPDLRMTATDASDAALALARENAERLGLRPRFAAGTWLAAVPGERFDLIVSNPPYIAAGDPHLAALRHEPLSALVSGVDGLDDIRAIVEQATRALVPGGWLLLEHGHDQGGAVQTLLDAAGFEAVGGRTDLAGIVRCSGARWPSAR